MEDRITPHERQFLTHNSMFGSDGYPIFKRGRSWWVDSQFGCGGCPSPFKTKRAATAFHERYVGIIINRKAGRGDFENDTDRPNC